MTSKTSAFRRFLAALASFLLACIFGYAAAAKTINPWPAEAFVHSLAPELSAFWIVRGAAMLEFALAVTLLSGFAPRVTCLLALTTLVVFTIALWRSTDPGAWRDCGCFGSVTVRGPAQAIARNGLVIALASAAYLLQSKAPNLVNVRKPKEISE